MLDKKEDGKNQIRAGTVLLTHSRLVSWNCPENKFDPEDECHFEQYCQDNIHEKFGRLVCWINFSAGAELFAKGVCLYADHVNEFRKDKEVDGYPKGDIHSWANRFANTSATSQPDKRHAIDYGTMGDLTNKILKSLFLNSNGSQKNLVISSYKLLGTTIRNRDAHAYVEDVRESHFYLVEKLFVPSFNILLNSVDGLSTKLSEWRCEAAGTSASDPASP